MQYETDAQELLKRIEKQEFEIAVMGREKMGKSSLINSLLGLNVLPNVNVRCTYTTTEVRQCPNDEDQKVKIEYLSKEEFELYDNSIKNKLNSTRNETVSNSFKKSSTSSDVTNLEKELEEIEQAKISKEKS